MRFANPHPPRRGAFLLIALFSCLQILFGFFLFTGNGQDSVLSSRKSIQIASYDTPIDIASKLNAIKPALGYEPQATTSLKHYCSQCGTFSYFDEYRKKAIEKAAAKQHIEHKKHMQQKHAAYRLINHQNQARYNPIKRHIIVPDLANSDSTLFGSDYAISLSDNKE